ncbi:BA75_00564T0 [Komagataella pastoris]|uniref:BA75_00564T0 n=1 Tax=Komagataella pastoris TaxID=4922 RepID=A0A1B2J8U3_PICPA|nr:BA75_00564T0 [Komagataella pastoris]
MLRVQPSEQSRNLWSKVKQRSKGISSGITSGIASGISNLSLHQESDGDKETDTLVHKALVNYYITRDLPFPDWLGAEEYKHAKGSNVFTKASSTITSRILPNQSPSSSKSRHSLTGIYQSAEQNTPSSAVKTKLLIRQNTNTRVNDRLKSRENAISTEEHTEVQRTVIHHNINPPNTTVSSTSSRRTVWRRN